MNVKSVEKNENNTAKLVLEVEKAQFQTALDKAYRKVRTPSTSPDSGRARLPGKSLRHRLPIES